jgi:antitoxin Phd
MKAWPVQDAKARFSELLESCLKNGPQLVTKRGADAAVLVPVKELLLADAPRGDLIIAPRGKLRRRAPTAI